MKDTKKITLTAILIALMIVLAFSPLGAISLTATVSMTTIFLPVAIGIILLDDFRYSLVITFAFALLMFVKAYVPFPYLPAPLDPIFMNPLISMPPRLLTGICAGLCYMMIKKIKNVPLRSAITGGLVAILNTIFTLSFLYLFCKENVEEILSGPIFTIISVVLLTNALPEFILAIIVCPLIVVTIEKIKVRREENEYLDQDLDNQDLVNQEEDKKL